MFEGVPKGSRIDGRYVVEQVLGRGGMGVVYEVVDDSSGERLALKRSLRCDREAQDRFRREFHTIAGLGHPGIVRVFDFGLDANGPYYTMELLQGGDLGERTTAELQWICRAARQIAGALALLHAHRLLHRDLKTGNVRCDEAGNAKLIDFGVLATMGITGEVAGTPSYVPPEAVLGVPLDARADLFGLGALLYRMLTGRHAYAADSIEALPSAWSRVPAPPSHYRKDTPRGLDQLVLSLLSIDPAGRPAEAPDVVAQIDAIAQLDPDPSLAIARGWIGSAAIVGRQRELSEIRAVIDRTVDGRGGALVLEGSSGVGKTRLLHEAGLVAQLQGAIVVRVRARLGASQPYAVVSDLVQRLKAISPDNCEKATQATTRAGLSDALGLVDGVDLGIRPAGARTGGLAAAPTEQRLRVQAALARWFASFADFRPLVVQVDDVQRCDEASAAVLASVAHGAAAGGLLVCVTQRTGESVIAEHAVLSLRQRAKLLTLRGLDSAGVLDLCVALFGNPPGLSRLAELMTAVANGSPLLCTAIARHFVESGVVEYEQGRWRIPASLDESRLPTALHDTLDLRVRRLSTTARALAEALSLVEGKVQLWLCMAVLDDVPPTVIFDALRELVFEEVLLEGDLGIEFRHDSIRELIRRRLPAKREAALHLKLAQAIDRNPEAPVTLAHQVGWHYLAGGDRLGGARRLEEVGLKLYAGQSFADAIGVLEAVVDVYQTRPELRRRSLELRQMLARAGVICDRDVVLRHTVVAIDAYGQDAGLTAFPNAHKWLGGILAVGLALFSAWVRWIVSSRARATRIDPMSALTGYLTLIGFAASAYSLGYDIPPLEKLARRLRPFAAFRGFGPQVPALLTENFLALARGDFTRVVQRADRVVHICDTDRISPFEDIDRVMARGGAQYMAASVLALHPRAERGPYIRALRDGELRFWQISAFNLEEVASRIRGDEARARQLCARAEVLGVQLGNRWAFNSQMTWVRAIVAGMTGDALAIREARRDLEGYVQQGYTFGPWVTYLRAEEARVHGEYEEARQVIETGLQQLPVTDRIIRQLLLAADVDVLVAQRRPRAALQRAQWLMTQPPDAILDCILVRTNLAILVARSMTRPSAASLHDVDVLVARAEAMQAPVLVGLVCEGGVRIARALRRPHRAERYAAAAVRAFEQTEDSILVGRGRALLSDGDRDTTLHHATLERPTHPEPDQLSQTVDLR